MQVNEQIGCFKTFLDPYNGITIESNSLPISLKEFEENLEFLLNSCKNRRNLIWIYIDINKAKLIPLATKKGFFFHSCDEEYVLLVKRLKKDAIVPTAANHTLGVGAVVINENKEILLIKEKIFSNMYKLPGGHVDNKELIPRACVREVYEETGIRVEFKSLVCLSHLYPHQFHKSNLYIACLVNPLTKDIDIKDTDEIIEAKWMDLKNFFDNKEISEFSKILVKVALKEKGFVRNKPEFLNKFEKNIELFFPSEK